MYMWKAVDGENSCKTQHRTEDASVITDTDTDTAGKVKLGWRWVAKQLAGSQVTVCSLKQLKYHARYAICQRDARKDIR